MTITTWLAVSFPKSSRWPATRKGFAQALRGSAEVLRDSARFLRRSAEYSGHDAERAATGHAPQDAGKVRLARSLDHRAKILEWYATEGEKALESEGL